MAALRHAGLKEIGRVAAHLMEVGHDVGAPAVVLRDACSRLRMGQEKPVAVQVKPVVIGTPAGPDFVVLAIVRVPDRAGALVAIGPLRESAQAIRIDRGLHENDRIRQERLDGASTGSQMVREERRHVGATGFVAVNAVALPDDQRAVSELAGAPLFEMSDAQRFQVADVLRR